MNLMGRISKYLFEAMRPFLLGLALLPGAAWGVCVPTSASVTYAADDYFYLYINGNQVVNGEVFDAGNPPVTVNIPAAYFDPSGTNYVAAMVRNSSASLLGGYWVISMTCTSGARSY